MMDSKAVTIILVILVSVLSATGKTVDIQTSLDPGKCNKTVHGLFKLVKDRENNDKLLICAQEKGIYVWTTTDGSSPTGEFFNPGYDCSEILKKDPKAKNGFYWVNFNEATPKKVWCDMTTDGGGFMLIAKKDGPETWSVPSDDKPVDPFGHEHWSSALGNAEILDFRVQVSTTQKFENTKAHWSYRLTNKRPLKRFLVLNEGGCGGRSPGIGHIAYVKDLMSDKIVSTTFKCSIFGDYHRESFGVGWAMMNTCLMKKCKGFGYHHKYGHQNADTGSFSYSATKSASGITQDSTTFIGCDKGKCCACYGPIGGTASYCDHECRAKNGGKIIKKAFIWIWIRSTLPKGIWNKCMEYQVTSKRGKTWYRVVGNADTPEEIVVAEDGSTFKKIPPIPGLLSYRKDDKKLYLRANKTWTALINEKEVKEVLDREITREQLSLWNSTCKKRKEQHPRYSSGVYFTQGKPTQFKQVFFLRFLNIGEAMRSRSEVSILASLHLEITVYCDMNSGWTLVARFSGNDGKNWMDRSGGWWYDTLASYGATSNPEANDDMISEAFWKTSGNEIKITRSDDSSHTALLQTTSNCLAGKTFRSKITSYGNFRYGTVWSSDRCLGSCSVSYGGQYSSTAGFKMHSCSSEIQSSNYIGFWCDWESGDGAVMMIGGGGSSCNRADHGIGITEENEAKFGKGDGYDFGDNTNSPSSYSLNLWVR